MRNLLVLICLSILLLYSCGENDAETLFKQHSSSKTGITFSNIITENDSINILTEEYIFNGGGVAVADFNNDSKPDLFFTGNQVANKLYLNNGDFKFNDVSQIAGIEAKDKWSTGIAITDINGDQWLDIYVCAAMSSNKTLRANMLFVHQGLDENGYPRFKEMAADYGIAETSNSMGATFFDYDKDGLLDLYVLNNEQVHTLPTNYRPIIKDGSAVSNDRLFHNNGNGTFTDVTIEAGITFEGFGLGVAVADLNYDGWPDLHISNDYITNDLLYINNQDGTFSNSINAFLKHQSRFSMGSDISDFNNDGYLDIVTLDMLGETNYRMKTTFGNNNYMAYVLNERYGYEYQYSRNMLHMGNAPGIPYSEIGMMAGVSKTDWSWSPLFADFDNDGFRDLFITNGFPRDITDKDFGDYNLSVSQFLSPIKILDSIPVVKTPNYAYKNNGDGTFKDTGKSWGLNLPSFSNGAAFADFDNDGDLDYVVNNINDEAYIFENTLDKSHEKSQNNYLKINLEGPNMNSLGLGTKIVLRFENDDFQYYEHSLTRGYMSSVSQEIHFGLGNKKSIKELEILWSDGLYQIFENISTNQLLAVKHKNSIDLSPEKLRFPLKQKVSKTLLTEVSELKSIVHEHTEGDIVDYNIQRTLPHKLTQNGPCLVAGDLNKDGLEDFIIGSSAKYAPTIFFQKADGTFEERTMFDKKIDQQYEEQSMALFDLENDGDLDLYMVSGSNEFEIESDFYTDRLFINDGNGNFEFASNKMPTINASGSVVKAHDFDQDGFTDLFIGGRTPIGRYPTPENSFLLKNEGGILKDVTDQFASDLRKIGMVTDAIWADIDLDGQSDLVVVGELMSITIFKNEKYSFKKLENTGLEALLGWWECIEAADFDNDGDIDFVAGNMGTNNFYKPSTDKPVTLLAKDFDDNGSIDPIMFAYFKKGFEKYESFPVAFWGDLFKQSTLFRSKFNLYKEYAQSTQDDLLTAEEKIGAKILTGNWDKSSYIENLGGLKFKPTALPQLAQTAPINQIIEADINEDGILDLLLIGNDYGNEIFVGRLDAFNGLVLMGDGNGNFNPVSTTESGFLVPGDAKSMVKVKDANGKFIYVITQNKGKSLIFQKQSVYK